MTLVTSRGWAVLAYAVSALGRRRAKAFAIGGGLLFAVALISAVLLVTDSLRAEAERSRMALPDVTVQRLVAGRPSTLHRSDADKIADIPAVRAVRPRVWGYLFLPALQGNVTIIGVPAQAQPLEQVSGALSSGRELRPGAHEMVTGGVLAHYLGIALGDVQGFPTANPEAHPLTLVGTFGSAVDLYAADVILCDEDDARALLFVPDGEATDLAVSVANPAEARIVARTILARLPGTRALDRQLLARVYAIAFGRRAGLVLAASLPALLALLVLAWDRVSGLGESERREIATLKAVGWSLADVLWEKFFESMLVGFSATACGLVLAYVWVFVLGAPGLRPALAGFSVLYPETALTPVVDGAQILGIGLTVLAPYVALSILPAWRAAMTDPVDIMRNA